MMMTDDSDASIRMPQRAVAAAASQLHQESAVQINKSIHCLQEAGHQLSQSPMLWQMMALTALAMSVVPTFLLLLLRRPFALVRSIACTMTILPKIVCERARKGL